ncbi:MAG: YbhB/YbcL family Raf kinase inhibitor-like protein [bacterium]
MKTILKYLLILILIGLVIFPIISRNNKMDIKVTSTAFKDGEMIPSKYTCDGENISPQIAWTNYPKRTETFVLIADDPDAPMGTWVHWVVYNIPTDDLEFKENFPKDEKFENGTMQGTTDFRRVGYGGPCPPSGTHRYFFKIYALDVKLNVKPGLTKKEILKEMEGHIIAEGQLMGKYKRK